MMAEGNAARGDGIACWCKRATVENAARALAKWVRVHACCPSLMLCARSKLGRDNRGKSMANRSRHTGAHLMRTVKHSVHTLHARKHASRVWGQRAFGPDMLLCQEAARAWTSTHSQMFHFIRSIRDGYL